MRLQSDEKDNFKSISIKIPRTEPSYLVKLVCKNVLSDIKTNKNNHKIIAHIPIPVKRFWQIGPYKTTYSAGIKLLVNYKAVISFSS